jgi:hypothetical protein
MNPAVAGLYAIFANVRVGMGDPDLIEMKTLLRHRILRFPKGGMRAERNHEFDR